MQIQKTVIALSVAALFAAGQVPAWAQEATAEDKPKAEEKAAEAKKIEVVDFRKLKETFKETLGGLKRVEAKGERTKLGELTVSSARAQYAQDKDKEDAPSATVELADYSDPSMSKMLSAWSGMEIDQESDTGYQKSTKVAGNPAMEEYQSDNKSGSLTVLVAGRFIVTLNASNVTKEQFQKMIAELPLKEIAALKN